MDANGLRFWMAADLADWQPGPDVVYDRARRILRLASQSRRLPAHPAAPNPAALAALRAMPAAVRDPYATYARWDAAGGKVMAFGALPGAVEIFTPQPGEHVLDLALGAEGVLYIALDSGAVALHDLRSRWDDCRVDITLRHTPGWEDRPQAIAGFQPRRLAAHPAGGVWVLDAAQPRLARLSGLPQAGQPGAARVARPCQAGTLPQVIELLEVALDPGESGLGLACAPDGRLALITAGADDAARLRLRPEAGAWSAPVALEFAFQAYSLAWVSETLLALRLAHIENEAPVFPVDWAAEDARLHPIGALYPLRQAAPGPFLNGGGLPPHYPHQINDPLGSEPSLPLDPILRPMLALEGSAPARHFDSGKRGTAWHRLYLEARLPVGCGVRVWLAAADSPDPAGLRPEDWYPHEFGSPAPTDLPGAYPHGAWLPQPSELPFAQPLLACPSEKDVAGLFTALIQRAGRAVRTLAGRYLHLRIELSGDGRTTPEVAGLRAYAERFSYVEHYLPDLYHETCFGPEADTPGPATPTDFWERFVDNIEGILTPLEDRIAAAHLLTYPQTAPDTALDWLGGWVGLSFDPDLPAERRRAMLAQAATLCKSHGTFNGLRLALDLVTGGLVRAGLVYVFEDFRLRRTFATILGAYLEAEDDPLMAGLWSSGNSFVGDTLFLGDERQRLRGEFMALYRADVELLGGEQLAVEQLYERLANRVSILVRHETPAAELRRIQRVIELEVPAHVQAQVLPTSSEFLVGVSALLGVDSFLSSQPPLQPLRVQRSLIGGRDLILSPASLDPRLQG